MPNQQSVPEHSPAVRTHRPNAIAIRRRTTIPGRNRPLVHRLTTRTASNRRCPLRRAGAVESSWRDRRARCRPESWISWGATVAAKVLDENRNCARRPPCVTANSPLASRGAICLALARMEKVLAYLKDHEAEFVA